MSQLSSFQSLRREVKTSSVDETLDDHLQRYAMSVGTVAIWCLDLIASVGVWMAIGLVGLFAVVLFSFLSAQELLPDSATALAVSTLIGLLLVLVIRRAQMKKVVSSPSTTD